jgi:hypothetical protein
MRKHARAAIMAAIVFVFVVSGLAWSVLISPQRQIELINGKAGWGQEAAGGMLEFAAALSPIADANACGMGASSCFKCHNGTRAAAPKMDRKSGAWHIDHKSVNGSCAGCHKGNQRLIKKELAHEGLIKDPRQGPGDTCDSCHKTGNTSELLKQYRKS